MLGAILEGLMFALVVVGVAFRGQALELLPAARGVIATVAGDPLLSAMTLLGIFVVYKVMQISQQ